MLYRTLKTGVTVSVQLYVHKIEPFNTQKRLKFKFSLRYPYIIHQTSNENNQTYWVKLLSWSNTKFLSLI